MLPPLLDESRRSPADKWLWALLGFLVVGLLVAFWLVCQQQVQKAETRDAAIRAQRLALMDECAPRNGRATCMPERARDRRTRELDDVMSALR
jgi:hypothetical protein